MKLNSVSMPTLEHDKIVLLCGRVPDVVESRNRLEVFRVLEQSLEPLHRAAAAHISALRNYH